jgi:hypothetical protein
MAFTWLALAAHHGREMLGSAAAFAAFRRELFWAVPACAALGAALRFVYGLALSGQGVPAVVFGVPRAFVLFPVYAWIMAWAFFGAVAQWLWSFARGVFRRDRRGPELEALIEWRLGIVVWYAFLPFIAAGGQVQGGEVPPTVSTRNMLLRLLTVFPLVFILTEESPNAFKLAGLLGLALTDYLTAALRIAPALQEKAMARRAQAEAGRA